MASITKPHKSCNITWPPLVLSPEGGTNNLKNKVKKTIISKKRYIKREGRSDIIQNGGVWCSKNWFLHWNKYKLSNTDRSIISNSRI